jgi:hypothetical protein
MQLSRGFRALKIWLSVRTFGTRAFAAAIDRCLDLAGAAEDLIEADPELELLSPASLGVVCFRRRPAGSDDEDALERANARLVAEFAATGDGLVSSTRLRGRYAIRLCILNHTSTAADVEQVLDWFAGRPVDVAAGAAPSPTTGRRDSDVIPALGAVAAEPVVVDAAERVDIAALRRVPLFAAIDAGGIRRLHSLARSWDVVDGEKIVEQWELGRDFYVVLDGAASVVRDGAEIGRLAAGDFFGEFAALEWGASFSYSRLATVIARGPTRLAVFGPEALSTLMVELPGLEREITRVRRRRLSTLPLDENPPVR